MNLLKQSTAATIKLGPFVDDTDGKTAETALTIGQADIRLSKNGGDIAQSHNTAGATHDELGYYNVPLDATDTNTLGRLLVAVHESGALPVWQEFMVVTANVYDTLCSTDTFDVNVTSLADDVITAAKFDESTAYPLKSADTGATQVARVGADSDTLETLSDEIAAVKAETALILADTGTDGVKIASAQTVATVTNLTNLPTMPTDWVTAAGLKADAVTEIQDGVTLANTQGAITWGQQKIIADVKGEGALHIQNINADGSGQANTGGAAGVINSSGGLGQANFGVSAGVFNYSSDGTGMKNEGQTGLRNVGSVKNVTGFDTAMVSQIQSGLATSANLQTVDDNVDAIKTKTDNLPASPAAVGSAMTLTAAYDKAKDDVLTPLAVVDGIVDAIKVQTDKIPATPASAGEYTTNIGAIKAKTDNLPLSPASSGEYTSALTVIQNDLDNPNQYKADVSNLALQATSLAIKGQTDKIPAAPAQTGEYNAALTAIQSDLDNPAQYKADVSGLATQASVNAIPTTPLLAANYTAPDNASIAAILEDTGTTIPATLAGLATSAEVGAITMLDEVVVGSYTMQDILKILAAKMVGKATGGGTATITYRGVDDTSDVIIETVDSNGNRSAVTLTV